MVAGRKTSFGGFGEAPQAFAEAVRDKPMSRQVAAAQEALAKNFETANAELVSFWQERLASACALPARLAQCKTPMEALEVQAEYGREFLSAYTEAWTRLSAIATSTTPESAAGPSDENKRRPR